MRLSLEEVGDLSLRVSGRCTLEEYQRYLPQNCILGEPKKCWNKRGGIFSVICIFPSYDSYVASRELLLQYAKRFSGRRKAGR